MREGDKERVEEINGGRDVDETQRGREEEREEGKEANEGRENEMKEKKEGMLIGERGKERKGGGKVMRQGKEAMKR